MALLSVLPGRPSRLCVLVHQRGPSYGEGAWSLPGTFIHVGETLDRAALRALRTKVGVQGESPRQLRVFDDPARDDRGWVMSVAHVDLVPYARVEHVLGPTCLLAPVEGEPPAAVVAGRPGGLLFDHDAIVAEAVRWARAAYADRPDPMHVLGEEFTLYQLQMLHEAVLGRRLTKDTWRRFMTSPERGLLRETGRYYQGSVGKPARLFRRTGT